MKEGRAEGGLCEALDGLLRRSAAIPGDRFTGLGVIVSGAPSSLPTFPIGPKVELASIVDLENLLGSISVAQSPHHDGFHILTPSLEVHAISQYFSPPVVVGLAVDRSVPFGGRYLAALFGSTIDGVLATGIATPMLGVVIFINGQEASHLPM